MEQEKADGIRDAIKEHMKVEVDTSGGNGKVKVSLLWDGKVIASDYNWI